MINWLLWLGIALVLLGVLFLSPLADLLPVDTWRAIKDLFGNQSYTQYYRAVPGESSKSLSIALLILGISLVAVSYYLRKSQ